MVDSQGSPHAVVYDYAQIGDHSILYLHRDNGVWQSEVVDTLPWIQHTLALAVDGEDVPHMAYVDRADSLKVGRRTASG